MLRTRPWEGDTSASYYTTDRRTNQSGCWGEQLCRFAQDISGFTGKIPYPGRLRPLGKPKCTPAMVLSPGLRHAARCGLAFAAVTRACEVAEFSFPENAGSALAGQGGTHRSAYLTSSGDTNTDPTASVGLMALVILLEGCQHLEPGIAINTKSSLAPRPPSPCCPAHQ